MGANLGEGGGKRRAMMSDINVTPMVDVMLVLLIIFLGLIGVLGCRRGLPRVWNRRSWTVIQKKDGSAAFHIAHDLCSESEREAFEQAFKSTLETGEIPTST